MAKWTLPEEKKRIEIISGLLRLKRDGHFHAIWATDYTIKVQYAADGPIKMLGWRKACDMVKTASESAALALAAELEASRKPPASERAQRAVAARNGKTW